MYHAFVSDHVNFLAYGIYELGFISFNEQTHMIEAIHAAKTNN